MKKNVLIQFKNVNKNNKKKNIQNNIPLYNKIIFFPFKKIYFLFKIKKIENKNFYFFSGVNKTFFFPFSTIFKISLFSKTEIFLFPLSLF